MSESSLTTLTDTEIKGRFPGLTGTMTIEGLSVRVRIVDARKRFGHLDLLVTPAMGNGQKWIQSNRILLDA